MDKKSLINLNKKRSKSITEAFKSKKIDRKVARKIKGKLNEENKKLGNG